MDNPLTIEELLEEFKVVYTSPQSAPKDIGAIVILTGDTLPVEENLSRIRHSVALLNELGRDVPIIFSGVTEEKDWALSEMKKTGVPEKLCHFQDCGRRGVANTKTQFTTFATDPLTKNMRSIVFITNAYHIPRTKRTAGKYLPKETSFVISSPIDDYKIYYNAFLKVMGEIDRIMKYSAKGDISVRPR